MKQCHNLPVWRSLFCLGVHITVTQTQEKCSIGEVRTVTSIVDHVELRTVATENHEAGLTEVTVSVKDLETGVFLWKESDRTEELVCWDCQLDEHVQAVTDAMKGLN